MIAGVAGQHLRIALWVFLAFSTLYVLTGRGHFIGTDEIALYQTTRSLWEDHDLHIGRIINAHQGRGGAYYSQYSVGQAVAALPLYAIDKGTGWLLANTGRASWSTTLAGPSIGTEPSRWGGDIEIFFVSLYGAFTTALLCAVFFTFSLRLGGSLKASLAATALLGLATYVGPFSSTFLQHSSDALLVLWSFYFLMSDSQRPDWRSRALAGILLGLAVVFRYQSVIAIPALGLYHIWSVGKRRDGTSIGSLVLTGLRQLPVFALPVLVGIAGHLAINYVKFDTIWGKYSDTSFNSPIPTGLYGFLFSSGDSIFLYTPLLLLLPWMVAHFFQKWRREAVLILTLALCYLLFYSSFEFWHGLWSDLGPRYLMPTVPLLLLPLAGWLDARGRKAWLAVAPLTALGIWVQLVHFAANFSYVSYYEKYLPSTWPPDLAFLFIPERSPLLAHMKATLAWDYRVDLWLVNVYRAFGTGRLLFLAIPLLCLLGVCLWRLHRNLVAAGAIDGGIWRHLSFPWRARRGSTNDY